MPQSATAAMSPPFDLCAIQFSTAENIAAHILAGRAIDGTMLAAMMRDTADADLAAGLWSIRHAYDAAEAAQVIAIRRNTRQFLERGALPLVEALAAAAPSQTRRSETQLDFQQFSTPLPLAWLAAHAARLTRDDIVIEPSAGTGLLAIFAEIAGCRLILNELEPTRRGLLGRLFPKIAVTGFDAAAIHAHLAGGVMPTVAILNPPYARTGGRIDDRHAAARHVRAAIGALAPGGRCVAILPSGFSSAGTKAADLAWLAEVAAPTLSIALPPRAYARHGTGIPVRLIVFDKAAAVAGPELGCGSCTEALDLIDRHAPLRIRPHTPVPTIVPIHSVTAPQPAIRVARIKPFVAPVTPPASAEAEPVRYTVLDEPLAVAPPEGIYQPYRVARIAIEGAHPHPTPLVESLAMAAVLPPVPSYRPLLPRTIIETGILSDPQIETVICAGEAHSQYLPGWFRLEPETMRPVAAEAEAPDAFRYRRGYLLADGTGCGKGRQIAGIIRDNWAQGRTRAAWISVTSDLAADAQRDWTALGGVPADVVPLSRFRPNEPISLAHGILFTTFATLRQAARQDMPSRLDQIIAWLGEAFEGAVVFDEAHAMANALPSKGTRGVQKGSAQGLAGLALQQRLSEARIVYSSATDATEVRNLGYLDRVGLWGATNAPFPSRESFVSAMERGGVAAAELVARDLKAMGLKTARALSFAGTTQETIEHALTPAQIAIYDSFAGAFEIIHNNLRAALEASGAIDPLDPKRADGRAMSSAHSTFESVKQRLFNALLTGMKCPTLIARIRADLAAGKACVIQLVSTGEAILERRLAELSAEDRAHLDIDMTPREGVVTYLRNSFPVQMMTGSEDAEGNYRAELLFDEGRPVLCPDAVRMRDELIEHLCALPAVPSALDQIIAAFGEDVVAEVTGRSRRLIYDADGRQRLQRRPASANLAEVTAFQKGDKRVLAFSLAGSTGRGYQDLNNLPRNHYLLEAGWRADTAIQGFGRTHRADELSQPCYLLVTTNVKAERRFTSTIARRLDSLGALTRGQRQTGGQGLFRPEDNLESDYAIEALYQWYGRLRDGYVQAIGLGEFEARTGLRITDGNGCLLDELPPIQRWLNRMLALPIALQNAIFEEYEDMIAARILAAREAGSYDEGVENLRADRITVIDEEVIRTDSDTGAETKLVRLRLHARQRFANLDLLLSLGGEDPVLLVNERSGNAAVRLRAPSFFDDEDGHVETRFRLERPRDHEYLTETKLDASHWRRADRATFQSAWDAEIAAHHDDERVSVEAMITGLILPVWKHVADGGIVVRRAVTEDGRSLLGPLLDEATVLSLKKDLGHSVSEFLTPQTVWTIVMGQRRTIDCAHGVRFRRALTLGVDRLEIADIPPGDLPVLKGLGLTVEIHSFKTRVFVPDGDRTDAIIAALLERYPPVG